MPDTASRRRTRNTFGSVLWTAIAAIHRVRIVRNGSDDPWMTVVDRHDCGRQLIFVGERR
jgi:hypothetical protein